MKTVITPGLLFLCKLLLTLAILFFTNLILFAQVDSLSLDDIPVEPTPIRNAFNGSYIINNQSTNTLESGRLDFLILHRFGEFSDGAFNAYGLDYAAIRLGFEYGITNNMTVALGRSSVGKNYDSHLKYKFLTQTQGASPNIPVSMVLFCSAALSSTELEKQNSIRANNQFVNQLVYTTQILISRQFSEKFALEFIPSFIHRNTVASVSDDHNIYSLSAGGRLKLSKRIHLLADYSYVFNNNKNNYNPIALGIDIVTGGHIFQVYLTNTVGMIEKEFLTATLGKITNGDIRLGFTISRAFMLKQKVAGGKLK